MGGWGGCEKRIWRNPKGEEGRLCSAYRCDGGADGPEPGPDRLGELAMADDAKDASRRVREDCPGEVVPDLGEPGREGKE